MVSREQLRHLVLNDVVGKTWLFHPDMDRRHEELVRRAELGWERSADADKLQRRIMAISAQEWGRHYLRAVRRHAAVRWIENPPDEAAHREQVAQALYEVLVAGDALHLHGYPTAVDSRLFDYGHTLLERILSVQLDDGVGYHYDNAWQVINTMLSDTSDDAKSWHGLYLMAINTYAPNLTLRQKQKVQAWREKVVESIRNKVPTYLRDPRYDDLLALLFPEMADGLAKRFGKRIVVDELSDRSNQNAPSALPAKMFEERMSDRWIWAVTSSERVRMAELTASRARLDGFSIEPRGILYHLVRSRHASAPWLYASSISNKSGLGYGEVLRYLYKHCYIRLTNEV